ncbi:MAG: S8 family peptidase [Sporichthyaceae bacterium]
MRGFRLKLGAAGLAAVTAAALLPLGLNAQALVRASDGPTTEYVVLYRDPAKAKSAHQAIRAAGGRIARENRAVGTAVVRSTDPNFPALVRRSGAVLGAAHNRPVGKTPAPARSLVERLTPGERAAAKGPFQIPVAAAAPRGIVPGSEGTPTPPEPLAGRQWDMAMIGATSTGSYAKEQGDRRVRVGIIDTGVDASHPDIAPNFDKVLSRNFVTDIPEADGPCEAADCKDPVGVDDNGHGTHAASTIGSPINGLGIAGVAPGVTLVDLRAGQDSGFFFLQPTIDAIVYAADNGINVINMSFFVDPWLFNCTNNPKDSAEQQTEQKTIVAAVQRAIDYAIGKGVTPVGSMGNEGIDLGKPTSDEKSPGYPLGKAYSRSVDNNCLNVPTETDGVISISSLGPSGRKAYYSNYGLEQTDFAAPGGDAFDTPDGRVNPTAQILAAYPEKVGRAVGDIDPNGNPTTPFVVRDCKNNVCGYYQYLQGTSMASPHAAGVAALAVSRFGSPDGDRLVLEPKAVESAMALGADRRPCPRPKEQTYTINSADGQRSVRATCDEDLANTGFFGRGVVNAETLLVLPKLGAQGEPSAPAPAPTEPTPAPSAEPTAPAPTAEPTAPAPVPSAEPTPTPAAPPAETGELPSEPPPSIPPPVEESAEPTAPAPPAESAGTPAAPPAEPAPAQPAAPPAEAPPADAAAPPAEPPSQPAAPPPAG